VKVGGSLLAAVTGTLVGLAGMLAFGWADWRICLLMIGLFAVPVWALVLVPLHVFVPHSSFFWRPKVSISAGAAVGAILLTVYFLLFGTGLLWLFLPFGVLVGAVTGWVGSVFVRFYARPQA